MSIKLWEVCKSSWDLSIREVEYAKVTDHFAIKANGRRDKINTGYYCKFPSREAALNQQRIWLVEAIERAESKLIEAKNIYAEFLLGTANGVGAAQSDSPGATATAEVKEEAK